MKIPSVNPGLLADDVLERALVRAFEVEPSPAEDPTLPERVGPYRIVRRLGRGGMGVVYEAEQSNPHRSVALKVLAAGFDDARAQRRFENECQLLARLQHPAIAQVYSAGSAPSPAGVPVPYFAMELVRDAAPITSYAEKRSLSFRKRLAIFLGVLDGIQHGHERGVVHRDLKPANLLVDEVGRPKIIDFGVSRATDDAQAASPIQTRSGELLGTPHYMSPEQTHPGRTDVDERSDVYSLGVVLFELLARRLPYDIEGLGVLAVAQCVRERPALRLGAVDAGLRGDLETIVGKALEKRPERRYPSVAAFAADLRRYLDSEPIAARPPSAAYQLRLFARRHRALVAGTLGILVVSLAGTAVSLAYAARAEERSRELDREIYSQELTVARSALDTEDYEVAREELARTDPERRGWEWPVLSGRAVRSELALRLPGEGADYPTCRFSEAGRTLLAWRERGDTAYVFDARTGEARPALHLDGELAHATADPGSPLFFAMHSGSVVAWDARRRERVWSVQVDEGKGWLELAPAGDRLAVIVKGALEILWLDARSGRRIGATPVPMGLRQRSSAKVDPLGRWVYVAGALGTRFLDPRTGRELREVPTSLAVSMDGDTGELWEVQVLPRRARSSGARRPLVRRDPETLEETLRLDPGGDRGGPATLATSPRGGLVAVGYEDGSVLVHDATTGSVVTELDVMNGVAELSWSPDGRALVGVERGGSLRLWKDVAAPRPFEFSVDGGSADGAVDPDGRRVVCNGWERASLWDADTGELLWSVPRRHSIRAPSLRGELLVHGDKAGGLALLDASDGSERWRVDVGIPTTAGAIRADSKVVFSGHPDGTLRAWDAATGEPVFERQQGPGGVLHIRVREDGDEVASAGLDGVVVWNARTGAELRRLPMPGARRVAWAARSDRLAASNGSRIDVWELGSGALVATLDTAGPIAGSDLLFLPDGSRLLSVDESGWIGVWDTTTWELVVRLRTGPSSSIPSAHFLAMRGEDTLVVLGRKTVALLETGPAAPDVSRRRDELARARLVIDSVAHDGPLLADMLAGAETARADDSTLELARRQLRTLGQNARELNEAAWLACRSSRGTPEQFERAVELAEAACAEQPERASFLSTLGLARYRAGDHEGALDALRRATSIDATPGHPGASASEPRLSDLAFIAAALHELGRTDEARAAFSSVRAHAAGTDLDFRHDLREVEAVLASSASTE